MPWTFFIRNKILITWTFFLNPRTIFWLSSTIFLRRTLFWMYRTFFAMNNFLIQRTFLMLWTFSESKNDFLMSWKKLNPRGFSIFKEQLLIALHIFFHPKKNFFNGSNIFKSVKINKFREDFLNSRTFFVCYEIFGIQE